MRSQRYMSSLRIEPEVELVARIVGKLRISRLRTQTASHNNDALCQLGEVRVDRNGKGNIRQRTSRVDRDLMRMRMHLTNKKVRSIFGQRLYRGLTFFQLRQHIRVMVRLCARLRCQVSPGPV